jgi:hypothetical protein
MWEALRESVYQEYLDLFAGTWSITREEGLVVVEGFGRTFDLQSLILGVSDKRGDDTKRGEHGEGTKMGWMVFLRMGVKFDFFSGPYRFWVEPIDVHGKKCMKVLWEEVDEVLDGARYEILYDGELYEDRIAIDKDYLFTDEDGRGILDKSGIFVKGIWVQKGRLVSDLEFGYNLIDQKLDLSRKMVNDWEARTEIGHIWEWVEDQPMIEGFLEAVIDGKGERHILLAPPEHADTWQAAWKAVTGESAVIRTSASSAKEAEWRGANPVDVGNTIANRLDSVVTTDKQWVADRTQHEHVLIPDRSLSDYQRRVMRWCRNRVDKHYPGYSVHAAQLRYASGTIDAARKLVLARPDVFDDPIVAAETVAHELDHLINNTTDLSQGQAASVARMVVRLFVKDMPERSYW